MVAPVAVAVATLNFAASFMLAFYAPDTRCVVVAFECSMLRRVYSTARNAERPCGYCFEHSRIVISDLVGAW